jgi:putative flippase GtrA
VKWNRPALGHPVHTQAQEQPHGSRRVILYIGFALAASGTNLAVQWVVSTILSGGDRHLIGLAAGTATGLALKYVLDARFIFGSRIRRSAGEVARFMGYTFTGAATTALFWAVELLFLHALAFPGAKYAGGAIGLAAGYLCKYFLDSRLVFNTVGGPGLFDFAQRIRRSLHYGEPGLIFILSAGLYWFTSARSPGWVDATLLLNGVRNLELGAWVNTHNLFNLLGHLWLRASPFLDPHRSLVLFSAVLGSLTVMVLYLAAIQITGNRAAARLTAVAMTLSHSLWWHSTTIEVYTLNALLIALMLYLVFRFLRTGGKLALYLAFFAGGLGVSNHVLMGLYVFALAVLLVLLVARDGAIKRWEAGVLILSFAAGASLYAILFVVEVVAAAKSTMAAGDLRTLPGALVRGLGTVVGYATGGGFRNLMFPRGLSPSMRVFWRLNYLFLLLWNFPSAALAFVAVGLLRLSRVPGRRTGAWFYFAGLAAQVIWSANYLIWDMYAFALPVYVMLAVPLALGIDRFLRWKQPRPIRWATLLTLLVPLVLYSSFSHWPRRERNVDWYIAHYPESVRVAGFWDPAEYVFNPIKRNYRAVEELAAGFAARMPAGAHYWDDESKAAYPLRFYYQDVRNVRPDVRIHIVFGILMRDADAQRHAREIAASLGAGEPVFISALVEPEREILNQLFLIQSPTTPIEVIRSKAAEELCHTFPRIEIRRFPLDETGRFSIYELRNRRGRIEQMAAVVPGSSVVAPTGRQAPGD